MKRIAKFHKVSFEQFAKDWKDTFEQYSEEEIRNIYDSLKLPKRATTGSAGYDFYAPVDVTMKCARRHRRCLHTGRGPVS